MRLLNKPESMSQGRQTLMKMSVFRDVVKDYLLNPAKAAQGLWNNNILFLKDTFYQYTCIKKNIFPCIAFYIQIKTLSQHLRNMFKFKISRVMFYLYVKYIQQFSFMSNYIV